MKWYGEVLKKYAVFDGRASRSEFWMFTLINVIIMFVLFMGESAIGGPGIVGLIYVAAVFVPSLAVAVRRLHDTDRSGWWLLLSFVPFGGIVLIIFYVMDSTPGTNRYGPNPKGVAGAEYGGAPAAGG